MSLLTRKERSLRGLIVFAFPQDKESFFETHRTQKKRFSFSRSLRVFPSLKWCDWQQYYKARFHYYDGCLERRTVDSWDWDCALLVPSKTIAITRPTENIFGNSTCL